MIKNRLLSKRIKNDNRSFENLEKIQRTILTTCFKIVVSVREYLTGQVYLLQVMSNEGEVVEEKISNLKLTTNKDKDINYILDDLNKLEKINKESKEQGIKKYQIFQKLLTVLFYSGQNFINNTPLRHTSRKGNEYFLYQWQKQYQLQNYLYVSDVEPHRHYFSKDGTGKGLSFYNRGWVSEWFLSEITNTNKEWINLSHKRIVNLLSYGMDSIGFLQAGDYVLTQEDVVYAVQVKYQNNLKLMSYNSLQKNLQKLSAALQGQEINKNAIKEVFSVSSNKNVGIIDNIFNSGLEQIENAFLSNK